MEFKDFKNKFIEDIDEVGLNWLWNNSFLNYSVYYSQKYILNNNAITIKELSNISNIPYQIIEKYNLLNNHSIKLINDILELFNILYIDINNNFDMFINNKNMIDDFCSLYIIIRKLEEIIRLNYIKSGMKIRLWNTPLIRDIKVDNNIVVRTAMAYAEQGQYKKAVEILNDEYEQIEMLRKRGIDVRDDGSNSPVIIGFLFYKMQLQYLSGDNYIKTFNKLHKLLLTYNDMYHRWWVLSKVRFSEIYISMYNWTHDERCLELSKHWAKQAFAWSDDNTNQIIPYNIQYQHEKTNFEIVREPLTNIIVYSNITYNL